MKSKQALQLNSSMATGKEALEPTKRLPMSQCLAGLLVGVLIVECYPMSLWRAFEQQEDPEVLMHR